jgi:hypothetical protein
VALFLTNRMVADCTFWKFFIMYSELFFGVLQGSVLGPIFSQYAFPLFTILHNHLLYLINSMLTSDEILLCITLSSSQPHFGILSNVYSLYSWFSINGLLLNASKLNSILFSIHQRLCNFPTYMHVDVAGCKVPVKDKSSHTGHNTG